MAIQTAIKTIHGRDTVAFARDLNPPRGSTVASWGAALDGFELEFGPAPVKGAHNIQAMQAMTLGVGFNGDLTVTADSGLWDQIPHPMLTKISVLGILSESSSTSSSGLYLYNDGPYLSGASCQHTFPGTPAWAAAFLSGAEMGFTGGANQLMTAAASLSGNLSGQTFTLNPSVSISGGSVTGGGSAAMLYVAGTQSSQAPLLSPAITFFAGYGPMSYTFNGLGFNSAMAVILMSGFVISYGNSSNTHQVQKIGLSVGNDTTTIQWSQSNSQWNAKVSFLPSFSLQDTAGHRANTNSSITAQILLIPN